jgi:hypothetical protein
MKKLIVLILIFAAGIIACGKKIVPESGPESPERSGNDKTEIKAETRSSNPNDSRTSTPSFNNMQRTVTATDYESKSVAMEKGKSVYLSKCVGCHVLKTPSDYTVDQMNKILKVEIPKAKLDKKEAEHVTAYLLANASY